MRAVWWKQIIESISKVHFIIFFFSLFEQFVDYYFPIRQFNVAGEQNGACVQTAMNLVIQERACSTGFLNLALLEVIRKCELSCWHATGAAG